MKTRRDPHSKALLFTKSPEDIKRKQNDKYIEQLLNENISLGKKIKTLQSKYRDLEKRVSKIENKD